MTQEEKDLVLKDLCARLPYGVKVERNNVFYKWRKEIDELSEFLLTYNSLEQFENHIEHLEIKPYLRSISSITEEEHEQLNSICDFYTASDDYDVRDRKGIEIMSEINNTRGYHQDKRIDFGDFEYLMDFLNSHHFDYNGLIEKGLALEAPEDMYSF